MKSAFDSWSDLRVFLAVMRAGSTLAASKQLRQSQPTVARRIDVLEHVTGLTLFERSTQGLAPTEYALALLPQAEAVEAAVLAFEATVDGRTRSTTSTIRITAIGIAFSPRIGAILEAMEAAYLNGIARDRKGREAREGALAYDADVVARDYWRPVLDEIAVRLGKAQEVAA